jgi:hypothetical protein
LPTGMHVLPAIHGIHRPVAAARTRHGTQTNPTLRRAAGAYCFAHMKRRELTTPAPEPWDPILIRCRPLGDQLDTSVAAVINQKRVSSGTA